VENHLQKKTESILTSGHSRQELGQRGEDIACRYLEKNGYKIIARRFRYRRAEIDIIARKGSILVFIEVKTRRHDEFGYPEESVRKAKKEKLREAALGFLSEKRERSSDYRFDILSILLKSEREYEIAHFEDVF